MENLNKKLNEHFGGKVVRKDLTKSIKGNAIVPTYVLEYLLGQYCATDDEATIVQGVATVKNILSKHYVHREEAELVKSNIRERGNYKIIDRIGVVLNDKDDRYETAFTNLGLKKVPIHSQFIKEHPKLLTGGVWSLIDIAYMPTDSPKDSSWMIENIKPIQLSNFDTEEYLKIRKAFSTEEWIDMLLQSMGFNPEHFQFRQKLIQLTRLIPFCERNYNLMELGPKGTGKSHIFSELSPHGILISGGEVTVAKLFVNNSTGNIGLVGYWDTVAFDEFAGKQKKSPKALVDIMKNYMANKTFSRGRDTMGAEASMVFIGNTDRSVPYMIKHSNLFEALPKAYYDTAFLDRIHYYVPGWEVDIIRNEMFTDGYGLIVDYLAEVLKAFRSEDFSNEFSQYFALDETIATRDKTAITKTFGGLMKIIFPDKSATKAEIQQLLNFSMEGRRRVKEQLYKMDETFNPVQFKFYDVADKVAVEVSTLEMDEYQFANPLPMLNLEETDSAIPQKAVEKIPELATKNVAIKEQQKGVSYALLFKDYLLGSTEIHLTDPHLTIWYQQENLHEFCRMLLTFIPHGEELTLKIFTASDRVTPLEHKFDLEALADSFNGTPLTVLLDFADSDTMHDRYIESDNGWKIILGRGLDMFKAYERKERFNLAKWVQGERRCRGFEVTYVRGGS